MRTLFNTGCFVLAFLLTCVGVVACESAYADHNLDIGVGDPRDTDFEIDPNMDIPRNAGCHVLKLNKAKNAAVVPVYAPGEYENAYAMIMVIVQPGVQALACKGPTIWFKYDGAKL